MSRKQVDRNQKIRELRYEYKLSLQEIANMFGISRERVRQLAPENGIEILFLRTKEKHKYIRSQKGKTNQELAKELDMSPSVIGSIRQGTRYKYKSNSSAERGRLSENYVAKILNELGFTTRLMPYRHPYDILVNEQIRIDVKASLPVKPKSKGLVNSCYQFKVGKGTRDKCDFYICMTIDTKDLFVIPSVDIPENMDQLIFTYPTSNRKKPYWQDYRNRFDLIKGKRSHAQIP